MLRVASLSAETLAQAFEQSADCVKLIGLNGQVLWMNPNGLCAMEIDGPDSIRGLDWASLWPEQTRHHVIESLAAAGRGETARFDAFCPTAKGSPRWWNVTVSAVKDVNGEPVGHLAVSRDITVTASHQQALLIAAEEMRHRLKNTYAMIGALFIGFAKGNTENERFAQDMQKRLIALSAAQSLFAAVDAPCDIAVLVPALVGPFSSEACPISTEGVGAFSVLQEQADAIALVLGELAVNSTKHGALAHGGNIRVATTMHDAEFSVAWTERSTRPVVGTSRMGGQGLGLIDRIVRARHGVLQLDWEPNGLLVTASFPTRP